MRLQPHSLKATKLVHDAHTAPLVGCDAEREAQDAWLNHLLGSQPSASVSRGGAVFVLKTSTETLTLRTRARRRPATTMSPAFANEGYVRSRGLPAVNHAVGVHREARTTADGDARRPELRRPSE